jgi:hypothetical protein
MRTVLVILAGLCVWLLAERHRLSEGVAGMEPRLKALEKENERLLKRIAGLTAPAPALPGVRKTWIQERIEQSSNALDGTARGASIR